VHHVFFEKRHRRTSNSDHLKHKTQPEFPLHHKYYCFTTMILAESRERNLFSTLMVSSPSTPHHTVEELKAQGPPVLGTLAARMLMMTITINKENEEVKRSGPSTSPPHTIAPEEEIDSYHHHQQQHSSYLYKEEHQIRHEVPSTPPAPRPLIWQSETDIALRRALIREM
jgi:hypothetical protein